MGDAKSLAHTKWNCKYHIVFVPKYRRQVFYGEKSGQLAKFSVSYAGGYLLRQDCCDAASDSGFCYEKEPKSMPQIKNRLPCLVETRAGSP